MTDRWYVIVGGPAGEAYYYSPFVYELDLDDPRFVRSSDKQISDEREGTMAYAYKVYTGSVSEEVTIAGIQQGNMLVSHEKLLGVVNNGVLSQEELIKRKTGNLMGGSIAFMALGLILVVLGLRRGRKKARK